MLGRFESMAHEVRVLSRLLTRYRADVLGPAPELLELHFQISKWETFRNETLHLAGTSAPDTKQQLLDLLAPLEQLLDEFEAYIVDLFAHVLDLVRHGQPGVVVRLAKIMERETREDERTAAIRLAQRAKIEGAARFRGIATYGHSIKLYRHKFQETVRATALRRLAACWDAAPEPGPRAFYEQADWFYDDVRLARAALPQLFPADYAVDRLFIQAYHRALGELLQLRVVLEDADAASLLELYHVAQQHETRIVDAGSEAAWLEPSLLGGREKSIIDDYASLLTRKMDDWTANLMHGEITAFVTRDCAPDEGGDGTYTMTGNVILFQMVNQQMDLASQTGSPELLVRVVDHICLVLRNCQASWLTILQQEFKKQTTAKRPEDVQGGLVEYMIALANDQLASADRSEELLGRLESLVAPQFMAHVRENLDNTLNGFLDISKQCVQLLVEIVLFDLRPAFKDLFTYPAWYMEGITSMITETVRDYAGDYAARLEPNLYDVLSDDLITRLLTAYLTTLRRSARLRMPKAAERFYADIGELTNLIAAVRPAEETESRVEVLHLIHGILSAAPAMAFLPYWTFAKVHGPNIPFLEALLRARDDIDKTEATAIVDSARRKVRQEYMPDVPESGPTIMAAVSQTQSGGLTGLLGWNTGTEGIAWSALAQSAQSYLGSVGRRAV